MYCSKCGYENKETDMYCRNCGELLNQSDVDAIEGEADGINGFKVARLLLSIFLLLICAFVFLCLKEVVEKKNQINREGIYSFYITDQSGNLLMEGGIETAELEEVTSLNSEEETEYNVKIYLTKEAAVIFANITDLRLGETISIYLDDELLITSQVNSTITDGELYIPVGGDEDAGKRLEFKLQNTEL